MKVLQATVITGFAILCAASAQNVPVPDASGNAMLKGAYNFRQVSYYVTNALGTLSRSTAMYGTITFDGNGAYTIAGSLLDSTAATVAPAAYTKTGTYSISASGTGTMSGPLSSSDLIYGLVSKGIFIGSSTASNFADLFIAVPASPSATVATLQGPYSIASIEFPSTDPTAAKSAWFTLTPDGKGGLATVTVNGHVAGAAGTLVTQSLSSASYSFTGGIGTIAFPASASAQTLTAGNKQLFVSPDGKFVFGGSTTGWDIFIGVSAVVPPPPGAPQSGLYYQAGIDQDVSQLSSGTTTLAGYYGSLNSSSGLTIGHQHLNSAPISTPYDYTYADAYTLNSNGSFSDTILGANYIIGSNGIRIGYDTGNALGINVAIPAATLTGTGVFLNPQGVVNAASYAPFTAGIAPGEFVSLFGSNLAASTVSSTTLPIGTTLGSVQVMINGVAAPVAFVSPTMVSAIVPYTLFNPAMTGTTLQTSIANIQVINNGTASNTITAPVRMTAPGIFTVPADGLGYAAALHLDYSLVSTSNPAKTGETLAVFTDGLGQVAPIISPGIAGPTSPLSITPANTIGVVVDNQVATVSYAGLAPGFAGLYQINFQVPAGIHSGNVTLAVAGPDSLSSEATISIAPGTGTIAPTGIAPHRPRR